MEVNPAKITQPLINSDSKFITLNLLYMKKILFEIAS